MFLPNLKLALINILHLNLVPLNQIMVIIKSIVSQVEVSYPKSTK